MHPCATAHRGAPLTVRRAWPGDRAAHGLLRHGAGEHRRGHGEAPGPQAGTQARRGLYAQLPPGLPHQGVDDQAGRALAQPNPPPPAPPNSRAPPPRTRPGPQAQSPRARAGSAAPPRRELEKDPALKDESWERFLPSFKKKNAQRKKTKPTKKEYTPFPPAPTPRKVDLELESGEYFLAAEQKKARQLAARDAKQEAGTAASKAKRQERFVPPKEQRRGAPGDSAVGAAPERSAAELAATLKAKAKGKRKAEEAPPAATAVAAPEPKKKKKKKV